MKVIIVDNKTGSAKVVDSKDVCLDDTVLFVVENVLQTYTAKQIVDYQESMSLYGEAAAKILLRKFAFTPIGEFATINDFYAYMCDGLVAKCLKPYIDMERYVEENIEYIVVDNKYSIKN